MSAKGQMVGMIKSGTYNGQTNSNEDIRSLAFWHVMGASAKADEQMIYEMTKAMWENMDDFYSVAPVLDQLQKTVFFLK